MSGSRQNKNMVQKYLKYTTESEVIKEVLK